MYWVKKGRSNTDATVELALKKAEEIGARYIVVASCSGETAKKFVNTGFEIVCVTHHVGYAGNGIDQMSPEARAELEALGLRVLTTTHLLAGVDRAVRNQFGGLYPAEIMAQTLRMLGQGLKVCVEISTMALDAGLIPFGEEVVCVGGSGTGADTSAVIVPAHSNRFFETKIKEIICKPREF